MFTGESAMVRFHESGVVSPEATNEHSHKSMVDWVPVTSLAEENAVLSLERKDLVFEFGTAGRTDEYLEQILVKQIHAETSSGLSVPSPHERTTINAFLTKPLEDGKRCSTSLSFHGVIFLAACF